MNAAVRSATTLSTNSIRTPRQRLDLDVAHRVLARCPPELLMWAAVAFRFLPPEGFPQRDAQFHRVLQ